MSLRRCLFVPLLALAALVPFAGVSAAQTSELEVVASGLDNPRGLDIGRWGEIYVTEAGRGGDGPCVAGPEADEVCVGASGAVTKIWHAKQRRVLEGLPSTAAPDGSAATGPQDISLHGVGAYLVVGLGGNLDYRAQLGELGPQFGQLWRVSPFGRLRAVADLAAYEEAEDPDGNGANSNPTSVLARPARRYVVDAGGNDLLRVGPTGRIRTLAVFPQRLVPAPPGIPDLPPEIPMDAVPTAVAEGPDRDLYVSQLTGFPFPVGGANIYRVDRRGGEPEVYASGFTNVTDLAFGPDGSLYVVEFATGGLLAAEGPPIGALKRVSPDGSVETIVSEGLIAPYGVAVGRNGDVYVSNLSAAPGVGEVVRVDGGGWK